MNRMIEDQSSPGGRDVVTAVVNSCKTFVGPTVRFYRSSPPGALALALLTIVVIVALFANQIAPYDALHTDFTMLKASPTASHPMGTDLVGRDVLSRIIVGMRISLLVAFVSVAMGVGVGFFWGVSTGYIGGKFDLLGQRILDVLLSFPSLILALLLMVPLGRGFGTVVLAIAIITVPGAARLVRSTALSVTETAYVDGARAIGASSMRIIRRHVAPQCFAPMMIIATIDLGGAIFTEATLSFLGMGIPPPHPSWGRMMGASLQGMFTPPWWLVIYPGVAITITVLCFNLVGDGLRDHLDPRLRGKLD